jgi:hypothetical protein
MSNSFSRNREFQNEAEVQRYVQKKFIEVGIDARLEVPCGNIGRCDIVTPRWAIEVKPYLTRSAIDNANAQVRAYADFLGKKPLIVGVTPRDQRQREQARVAVRRAEAAGIKVVDALRLKLSPGLDSPSATEPRSPKSGLTQADLKRLVDKMISQGMAASGPRLVTTPRPTGSASPPTSYGVGAKGMLWGISVGLMFLGFTALQSKNEPLPSAAIQSPTSDFFVNQPEQRTEQVARINVGEGQRAWVYFAPNFNSRGPKLLDNGRVIQVLGQDSSGYWIETQYGWIPTSQVLGESQQGGRGIIPAPLNP